MSEGERFRFVFPFLKLEMRLKLELDRLFGFDDVFKAFCFIKIHGQWIDLCELIVCFVCSVLSGV